MVDVILRPINHKCPRDEAVFYDGLIYGLSAKDAKDEVFGQTLDFFKHLDKKDDRLLVLTADLLLENSMDRYLSAIMPAYKKHLSDNRDFTFSLKITVARALKLSPPQFFNGVDLVRKIRNEFVHNLLITELKMLNPKFFKEIDNQLAGYVPEQKLEQKTLQERFRSLSLHTFFGMNAQIENVRSLNCFLRDDSFLGTLNGFLPKKAVASPQMGFAEVHGDSEK